MSVIRGKIFIDREMVPEEVTVGGDWPQGADLPSVRVYTLEQLLEKPLSTSEEDDAIAP